VTGLEPVAMPQQRDKLPIKPPCQLILKNVVAVNLKVFKN
jgi:hypothetical protein